MCYLLLTEKMFTDKMIQQPFIALVDPILAAKQQPPQSPLNRGELQPPVSPLVKGELKGADTSALEKQIDEMVYKLYGLTPEDIALV